MKVFVTRAYLGFVSAHDGLHIKGVEHFNWTMNCKMIVSGHFGTWKKNG